MTRLVDIEQAVEAVGRLRSRNHGDGPRVRVDRVIAALRALPPAEPTEEEVERVAKIAYEAHESHFSLEGTIFVWEALHSMRQEGWRCAIRAAIAAMRASK